MAFVRPGDRKAGRQTGRCGDVRSPSGIATWPLRGKGPAANQRLKTGVCSLTGSINCRSARCRFGRGEALRHRRMSKLCLQALGKFRHAAGSQLQRGTISAPLRHSLLSCGTTEYKRGNAMSSLPRSRLSSPISMDRGQYPDEFLDPHEEPTPCPPRIATPGSRASRPR